MEELEQTSIDEDETKWQKCGTCHLKLRNIERATHLIGNYNVQCKTEQPQRIHEDDLDIYPDLFFFWLSV